MFFAIENISTYINFYVRTLINLQGKYYSHFK